MHVVPANIVKEYCRNILSVLVVTFKMVNIVKHKASSISCVFLHYYTTMIISPSVTEIGRYLISVLCEKIELV